MEQQEIINFVRENWLLVIAFNIILGIAFGLIPLFLGRRRGQNVFGYTSFFATVVLSLPSWLLGLVACVVFTVIIILRGRGSQAEISDGDDQ